MSHSPGWKSHLLPKTMHKRLTEMPAKQGVLWLDPVPISPEFSPASSSLGVKGFSFNGCVPGAIGKDGARAGAKGQENPSGDSQGTWCGVPGDGAHPCMRRQQGNTTFSGGVCRAYSPLQQTCPLLLGFPFPLAEQRGWLFTPMGAITEVCDFRPLKTARRGLVGTG